MVRTRTQDLSVGLKGVKTFQNYRRSDHQDMGLGKKRRERRQRWMSPRFLWWMKSQAFINELQILRVFGCLWYFFCATWQIVFILRWCLIMPLGNKENTSFLDPGASKEQVFQVTIDLAFNWSIYYWSLTHAKIPDGRNGGNIWKQRHLVMYRTNVCGPEGGLTMIRTWRSAFKLDNDKVKVNCCNLGVLRLTSTHTKHRRTIPWCWPHLKLSIQIFNHKIVQH